MKNTELLILGIVAFVLLSKPAPAKIAPQSGAAGLWNDLLGLGRAAANAIGTQPHELPAASAPPATFTQTYAQPGDPNFVGPPAPPPDGTPAGTFDTTTYA